MKKRGLYQIDTLLATTIVLLMVALILAKVRQLAEARQQAIRSQMLLDRLLAFSEYEIAKLSVRSSNPYPNNVVYTNWIMSLNKDQIEQDAEKFNLSVDVGFSPTEHGTCIYRIIAFGEDKEVKKLYFCGEFYGNT